MYVINEQFYCLLAFRAFAFSFPAYRAFFSHCIFQIMCAVAWLSLAAHLQLYICGWTNSKKVCLNYGYDYFRVTHTVWFYVVLDLFIFSFTILKQQPVVYIFISTLLLWLAMKRGSGDEDAPWKENRKKPRLPQPRARPPVKQEVTDSYSLPSWFLFMFWLCVS